MIIFTKTDMNESDIRTAIRLQTGETPETCSDELFFSTPFFNAGDIMAAFRCHKYFVRPENIEEFMNDAKELFSRAGKLCEKEDMFLEDAIFNVGIDIVLKHFEFDYYNEITNQLY